MTRLASKPFHGSEIGIVRDGKIILAESFQAFFDDLEEKLNTRLLEDSVILESYTVATLPDVPVISSPGLIYVSDETGGAVPAFSDGSNWRRCTDRAIVS